MLALALDDFPLLLDAPGFLRLADDKAKALCPCHDDHDPSLDIDIREGKALGTCRSCKANLFAAARRWGLPLVGTVFPVHEDSENRGDRRGRGKASGGSRGTPSRSKAPTGKSRGRIVATYDYRDASGTLLYQVCRMEPKDFRQRRPDPAAPGPDAWLWNLDGVSRVPYRLPELLASAGNDPATAASPTAPTATAPPVFIVEGEKDADRLASLSPPLVATTNAGGAGKWSDAFSYHLRGRAVVILPDNDDPGRKHAEDVAQSLRGIAASIRVVLLPNLAPKGDVSDWLVAGGTRDVLLALVAAAPEWTPGPAPEPIEADDDPHRLARLFLDEHRHRPEGQDDESGQPGQHDESRDLTLRFWRDEWQEWSAASGAWHTLPTSEVRARLYATIKAEFDRLSVAAQAAGEDDVTAKRVTRSVVANVESVAESLTVLPSTVSMPAWIGGGFGSGDSPRGSDGTSNGAGDSAPGRPESLLSFRNGILDVDRFLADGALDLHPSTPRLFARSRFPFAFAPDAACPHWTAFLESLWGHDPESIDLLQEWFGLQLVSDTSYHKLLLIVGPTRSGKGAIAEVLKAMHGGDSSIAAPTLASLSGPFGLQPLLDRSIAVIGDARLSGRTDSVAIVERLLSISGEDAQDVHRKNLPTLAGIRLPVRFTILTNELPNLKDASGAMLGRVLLLEMTESWLGREDRGLKARLTTELPGIALWSLMGLARLRDRGRFSQPKSGEELLQNLQEIASPIKTFVAESCEHDHEGRLVTTGFVAVQSFFAEWRRWCEENGREGHGTVQTFSRDLRAAFSHVKTTRPRDNTGERFRAFYGIQLRGF